MGIERIKVPDEVLVGTAVTLPAGVALLPPPPHAVSANAAIRGTSERFIARSGRPVRAQLGGRPANATGR